MQRRSFLKKAGLGLAAGAVAAPAIVNAQAPAAGLPTVSWRMTASWPKSLDTLYGGAEHVSKRVAAATGGKFNIKVFAAGEIVGGLQVLDSVQNGTVECGHTATYYLGFLGIWRGSPGGAVGCRRCRESPGADAC